ncbi:MAG: hypothetical protein ACTHL8_11435 [Burkholderiaceae bacterium]
MTIDLSAAALHAALPPAATGAGHGLQAGYGVSLTDLSGFQEALRAAAARGGQGELQTHADNRVNPAVQALFQPLEHINGEATSLRADAAAALRAGPEMSPGDMVQLTVRCQEFMFHCELTSNMANRASDGVQQLFRQQS